MEVRQRALVAAHHAGWARLQILLDPVVDTVPVHTMKDAVETLDRERIDLIICTFAFDESRMIEFLQAVKSRGPGGAIPFICCRALRGVLSDRTIQTTAKVCLQCGAATFVDIADLEPDKAQSVLKSAVTAYLPRR